MRLPDRESRFSMNLQLSGLKRILCLGAHADDIEIGCGGTLLRLIEEHPNASVHWVVFSANASRKAEAESSAQRFFRDHPQSSLRVLDFRDGYFPASYAELKDAMFEVRQSFEPDLVFTHRSADAHQDHRMVAEVTWQTFRQAPILEYEIPKYEGDLLPPNFYVSLTQSQCDTKVQYLREEFESQHDKPWYCDATFRSLLQLRGIESHSPSGLAEAFHASKLTV